MASSSFYSGSSQGATNVNAVEDSKNAAALSEAAAAASAAASANSAASVSAFATTATTKASESAASATASSTSAAASQASRVASEAAKVAAETAKAAAETARDAASVSEVASGAAEVAAEAAEINAAASAAAALSSKNAAATSASTASTKATESATSAAASEASNVAAGVAKVAAETAETAAQTAQTAAEAAQAAAESAETNAATSETNAATSASTATTQANIATTRAEEAVGWATASASSATASEAAKDAALAALDNFDDRYLGAKASDPTVDNDGNALVSGALYFNTTDDTMKVYEGSQWVAAYASLSGALLATNNLSDLTSASTGRANLGLGTAATTASTDYATAAQGGLAATATQPGDLATVATSGAYSDLSGTPALGTAASTASSAYATAAQGTLADSATQPGDLATVATSGAYGDLSGTPTLGTAAATASTDYATAAQGTLAASAVQPNDSAALKELDLSAIAANITDTAVDVFVYDTSKDSDGGAWRKRTQGTSWYNETLNTATRGSRKEFPAVAVIVAEQEQITIYDGDDPDLPMWMVFNTNSGWSMLYYGTGVLDVSAVAMLNGKLCVTSNNNPSTYAAGVTDIDFVKDRGAIWYKTGSSGGYSYFDEPISGRNVAALSLISISSATVVNYNLNDVAMTVLPNAPIDAATGLPVPTIAVATNGGVSVIKDDGTVVDVLTSSGQISEVSYNQDDYLWVTGGGGVAWRNWLFETNPTSDGQSPDFTFDSGSTPTRFGSNGGYSINKQDQLAETVVFGKTNTNYGPAVHLLYDTKMVAFIDPSYNTGWMNGDIKLATLSDTDDTNVTGSELVTNGTFDTDTSGWTAGGPYTPTMTVESGRLKITSTNDTDHTMSASQTITTVVGKTYVLTGDVQNNGCYYAGFAVNDPATYSPTRLNDNGLYTDSLTFTATGTSTTIRLRAYSTNTGNSAYADNISVRLAEEDRSVNGNGLQVFGTVTKSAVATGADLVAYSGFSTANRLQQPYNSDLDFGTGDFCFMLWAKVSDTSGNEPLIYRTNYDSGWGLTAIRLRYSVGAVQFTITDDAFIATDQCSVSGQANGVWQHLAGVRRGNTIELWLDGKLGTSTAITNATGSLNNSDATLHIGSRQDLASTLSGSISLVRISATAPSPEQIKKIYEDEKVLFQEGAQATLYGSSDAVTALAYDDTTELLHVGTSAGRSVFQGLKRVDNTTTAVGAAISASNGLVADE